MSAAVRVVAGALAALAFAAIMACGGSDDGSVFGAEDRAPTNDGGNTSRNRFGNDGTPDSGSDGGQNADECTKMDIVFGIDNSGSMGEEQQNLADNFPKFAEVIDAYKTKSGKALDYRVAVTTSDDRQGQGAFGAARARSAPEDCIAGPMRPWLERADGDVASAFACRARYGTTGSGIERPLESILLSVTDRIADKTNTANGESFLRKEALLAFVLITDEDEGSSSGRNLARPMAEYPKAFDALMGERGRWAAAVIAGETRCTSPGFGSALEAKNLKGFIEDVGSNGVFASICTGDLTSGLTKALATFDRACKNFPNTPVK